ncbi:MAG: amidohydrolase [Deltaproteobacteria bacterium]|nr:amidohydrolase [Deltaproteobacteria bacterium]NNK86510.1 amidohydrolase family protein [Desulfobacterales bacterium]
MHNSVIKKILLIAFILSQFGSLEANANELYFIDAHSQVDHTVVPINKIISLMDSVGVRHTILSARGNLKGKTLLRFTKENTGRVIPAVRTKGKPYDKGSEKYYEMLKKQIATKQYQAIAEVLLYHAKKGNKAPGVIAYPDDKRVQSALNLAIKNSWPLFVHIEFASLEGKKRKSFMRAFKKMLNRYPDQPFILTHMGQLSSNRCLRLINNHKNVYFHTGWTNPVAVKSSNQPWTNVFKGDHLSPEWKNLFIQYPQRFIFALDNVFSEHWGGFYQKQMSYWKRAFAELPSDASHLIAHGNAERLWHITQTPQ